MNSDQQKVIINIDDKKYINWKLCLENKLREARSSNIEIDCKSLSLTCTDISELIEIASAYDCEVIGFSSHSLTTIISSKSLGYSSQFFIQNHSNSAVKKSDTNPNPLRTHFHEGTVRSGEYLDISGDLFILGDVNPGAIVSAKENIIIWGRLLGIAHAGNKGNSQATISALQIRPVQLRIANKVARGPQEKLQLGLAEQAKMDSSGEIIISPLESIYSGKLNQT
tara:strand:+ start:2598 stop:3272 length:675 start_codon:yes stop_codon:yes gene_type:complete